MSENQKNIESNLIIENLLDETKNSILYTCFESNEINKKYILKTFNKKKKSTMKIFLMF